MGKGQFDWTSECQNGSVTQAQHNGFTKLGFDETADVTVSEHGSLHIITPKRVCIMNRKGRLTYEEKR